MANGRCEALDRVLAKGCWSALERFDSQNGWSLSDDGKAAFEGRSFGRLQLGMPGRYNELNALAAVAAARSVGVPPEKSLEALAAFAGVKRRMEVRGVEDGVTVIDDFAHHPTAIAETIHAVRSRMTSGRLLAVLEPRSNTMKLGTMKDRLAGALREADEVFCFAGKGVAWEPAEVLDVMGERAFCTHDLDVLVEAVLKEARPGDTVLCMSNGAFGGIHGKLLAGLAGRRDAQ